VVEPHALPLCEPGGWRTGPIRASVEAWAALPAWADLVGHFGGVMPAGSPSAILNWLADFSAVWDFRAGRLERYDIERVNYEPVTDAFVRGAIEALGLRGECRPSRVAYDHVLVLGGAIRAALGRTAFAAQLFTGGVTMTTLAGLGSLRPRNELELGETLRLGLPVMDTEADMMAVGLALALGLGPATEVASGDGWWHRCWTGEKLPPGGVHVLAAPSTRPGRRANTADTLLGWAEHVARPRASDRLLVVTNDPYVRHQHCDTIRLLGARFGCGIETVRLDAATTEEWIRPLSTTELLQEVRSAILATQALHSSL
jgi:hypothetical protein